MTPEERIGLKAASVCPVCGKPLVDLWLIKQSPEGLSLSFNPTSYCPDCDLFRPRVSSLSRCLNCGGNIIGVKLRRPEKICWFCKNQDFKFLTVKEERKIACKIEFADRVAECMWEILASREREEHCLNGGGHTFYLSKAKQLDETLWEITCEKCGKSFLAYLVKFGGS